MPKDVWTIYKEKMLNKYPRKEEIKVEKEKIALKENLVTNKNSLKNIILKIKSQLIINCLKDYFIKNSFIISVLIIKLRYFLFSNYFFVFSQNLNYIIYLIF